MNQVIRDQGGTTPARELEAFKRAVFKLGVKHDSPHLTLITLTSAAIPFIRITDFGRTITWGCKSLQGPARKLSIAK